MPVAGQTKFLERQLMAHKQRYESKMAYENLGKARLKHKDQSDKSDKSKNKLEIAYQDNNYALNNPQIL